MANDGGDSVAHILVVDDEPMVGTLAESVLADAGYLVTLASDFETATAAAHANELDLVVCDLVLGERDGHDVIDALRTINPRLPVIFMSGYGSSRYGSNRSDPVLAKPFRPAQLLARVEQAIAATAPAPLRGQ